MAGREGHTMFRAAERNGLVPGDEQKTALTHVTNGPDLALVVGYAGTGKSSMFSVRAAWRAKDCECAGRRGRDRGRRFETGRGIASQTIASLEHA